MKRIQGVVVIAALFLVYFGIDLVERALGV